MYYSYYILIVLNIHYLFLIIQYWLTIIFSGQGIPTYTIINLLWKYIVMPVSCKEYFYWKGIQNSFFNVLKILFYSYYTIFCRLNKIIFTAIP